MGVVEIVTCESRRVLSWEGVERDEGVMMEGCGGDK